MASRDCHQASLLGLRLVAWVRLCLWVPLLLLGNGSAAAALTDPPPRAVILSLAYEHDLQPILSSISQLEDTFNSRYRYDWVFFSTKPLSEEFRRLTSNATQATCMYEVVCDDHWSVPGLASDSNLPTKIRRWKSGPFAKEKRLKVYDWYWRIEPGAQFIHDIDFDVFRVMQDHGIAYGSNKAGFDESHKHTIPQHVKGFIDKNPDLLHAEADVSWLFGAADQGDHHIPADDSDMEDDKGSPTEAFASWLGGMYKSSLSPTFEIGSLAFLRGQSHQALLEHLDQAGDLYYRGLRDTSTPTLSASMFLPQKSVLHPRRREKRFPSPPDSTPKPKLNLVGMARRRDSRDGVLEEEPGREGLRRQPGTRAMSETMAEWFARWELMARDFGRQGGIPGLRSGNTVIDERNFVLAQTK